MSDATAVLDDAALALRAVGALSLVVAAVRLSAIDLRTRRLPNPMVARASAVTLGLLAAAAVAEAAAGPPPESLARLVLLVAGAAALFVFFALLWAFAPAGIGGGDVKIAPLVGGATAMLGGAWAVPLSVGLAALIAAVWALLRRDRGEGSRGVPFAPCLFAGACAAIAGSWLVAFPG